MTTVWRTRNGVPVPDLVPRAQRRAWVDAGLCPDTDLHTLFSAHVRDHPRRPAVVDASGTMTYAELDAEVRRIAALFQAAGIGERDVVGLRLPNGRNAVAAELAVYAIGAVALPYPLGGGRRDTLSLLGRSRARGAVLADPADLAVARELPYLEAVFTAGDRVVPAGGTATPAAREWCPPGHVDPYGPARILVSSGSEAEPKMVAYSHHAMAGGRATYVRALHRDNGTSPRHLVLVSLASSFGSLGTPVTVAALGGTLVLQSAFAAADALRLITRHRPTHVFGVPTMLRRLADLPAEADEDLSSLRAVVSSGAALPRSTAEACEARFGRPVITVYGSSDGVNCHTAAPGAPAGDSTGTPDPAVAALRVVSPDALPVPPGTPGEIWAKGPMTPMCYLGSPELDARYRTGTGWVRTGDLGRVDERGRLHVLGRLKHVVIRGGYTISPAEVERELATHPAVAEVACVPVPDPDLGERLCACVRTVSDTPALRLTDLTAHLLDRGLEKRKLPELLLRVPHMPLGPTGKICHRTLTTMAVADGGRTEQRERSGPSPVMS